MARKLILSSAIAAGAAVTSYLLIDENRRQQVKNKFNEFKQYMSNESDFPIEEAGKPELDDIENADMVAEGSQFGVQYYNEVKSE
ncbi:uncharacterized membrane protein (DUF106 family) [Alkalibacillus flavidus]|uniref:Uncharacterized membrane protein (DUF106 family) n=1 Tax=Alkalibacillus flavidus TaxID=546021 RepID=A0ABV2KQZ3_9BACI